MIFEFRFSLFLSEFDIRILNLHKKRRLIHRLYILHATHDVPSGFTGFVIYLTLIVYQQQHLFIVFFLAVFLGVFFFTTFFFATFFFAIAIPPNQDFASFPDGDFAPCHHLLPKTFYIVNNLSVHKKQMQHLFTVENY
jgi:hypothetical protein